MSQSKQLQQIFQTTMTMCAECARHVPGEKGEWQPEGGKGRSAKEILEHLAAGNFGFAKLVKNEPLPTRVDRTTRKDVALSTGSYSEALQQFVASGQALSQAMDAVSDNQLGEPRTLPWGDPSTLGFAMAVPAYHVNYHLGQLNYLQTLWGDQEDRL